MEQKCSREKVLEMFFKKPLTIHFIREISREIDLATTSVKNIIKVLLEEKLIIVKKSKPFDGYIANRDNAKFLYYKRVNNLHSLFELKNKIIEELYPEAIVLFGSYSKGEDVETSDIDLLIISKVKKEIKLNKFEDELKRKINLMIVKNLDKIEKNILKKINNGIVIEGEING